MTFNPPPPYNSGTMTCFRPLSGFLVHDHLEDGKNKLIIKPYRRLTARYAGENISDTWFPLACGKCAGCKLDRAQAWSVRLQLEASLYDDSLNHFVTLTYDNAHNPVTLVKRDVQLFIKRLRSHFPDRRISYFLAAEYGSSTSRPHYHILFFNLPLVDLEPYLKTVPNGLYVSKLLSDTWHLGNVIIGKVTEKSIKYTARYVLKKITSKEDKELYKKYGLEPEFTLMSRNPGIGRNAFQLEWFNDGRIPLNGRYYSINRYYKDIFNDMGYDYKPIQDHLAYLLDIKYQKIADADSYFLELENKEIAFKHGLNILMKRNLDQYGID